MKKTVLKIMLSLFFIMGFSFSAQACDSHIHISNLDDGLLLNSRELGDFVIPKSKSSLMRTNDADIYGLHDVRVGSHYYLLLSVSIPSRSMGAKSRCSAGEESFLQWFEYSLDKKLLREKSILYDSCLRGLELQTERYGTPPIKNITGSSLLILSSSFLDGEKLKIIYSTDNAHKGLVQDIKYD